MWQIGWWHSDLCDVEVASKLKQDCVFTKCCDEKYKSS